MITNVMVMMINKNYNYNLILLKYLIKLFQMKHNFFHTFSELYV
jgi:hypothetical protein